MAEYFVYIIKSMKDSGYYTGSCRCLEARLKYHNDGRQRSTKNRVPFALVYFEVLSSKTEALKREKQVKSYKGGVAFKKLVEGV
ncbi:MAG: GIY-YIG nuclease family protein [Bacteroidetes bacterium]|nr:GIY-YIG nuclease family protein [Bacteroidota bacterium]